ncbi:Protein phosphatase 2C 4 [Sphaceloma murrayae]|uniref:Protein phosphatase 2C 4 n=1 Tax=Sphaceloma murrayae TaxID=2082308 RepID=A0A2K1QJD0_9PEZI|nr:Protein phosphatase 2C 4 [Sphaceloma murrayae]
MADGLHYQYPSFPPPPYTVIDLQQGRPVPPIPQPSSTPGGKVVPQAKKTGSKKHSEHADKERKTRKHGVYGRCNLSKSYVSLAQQAVASPSQLCLRSAPTAEHVAPVPAPPSRSVGAQCLDSLTSDCVREGTELYKDVCRAIDNATSVLDVSVGRASRQRAGQTELSTRADWGLDGRTISQGQIPHSTYAYYDQGPYSPHQNNTTLQVDDIVPDAATRENVSSKVYQYANSRLPSDLQPFRAYMETYRLLSIAARYSLSAYSPPTATPPTQDNSLESHIPASFLTGTKAMVLKSIPVDNQSTLVFAIRGSHSFADWAVNFRPAPSSPLHFLDDPDNYVHSGFLSVAKSMIKPVAARLRQLLEQDPSRCNSSLLITGHSAGGAVAALLYAHMLSQHVESELTILTNVFRRVHCVTFGAPPVTLLPLAKPDMDRYRKWCFFGVVNQGDPVARASKEYVASLARLWLAPVPVLRASDAPHPHISGKDKRGKATKSTEGNKCVKGLIKAAKSLADLRGQNEVQRPLVRPVWKVPPAALSCAGRLVLMREKPGSVGAGDGRIEVCAVSDDLLRGVVFGDPAMHSMSLYARRVEMLAFRAVTGRET